MGNREAQAADISPPIAYDATVPSASGVYSRAIANASQLYVIPPEWRGNFVTFHATADCQIAFGNSTLSLAYNQLSTLNTNTLTESAATGMQLATGEKFSFRVPKHEKVTHFAVVGPASSGQWFAYMSNNVLGDF